MTAVLWFNCHVATMQGGRWNTIEDAAILTRAGRIEWVGAYRDAPGGEHRRVDLGGTWVTPGLIDCHTHAVFGGNRSDEFEKRLEGVSYTDIAAAGGGIASTVRHTRAADAVDLYRSARRRLAHLMRDGVTTVEIKSGYGLDLESERKMLAVARKLGETLPMHVRLTCLAAHALPPEYAGRADDYIDHVCDVVLPVLVAEGLVDAVDVFCESIAFSVAQSERVLRRARDLGVAAKIHAEQLSSLGGASMAASLGALSADHVEYLTEDDVRAMARAGTVAVLLPGAFHMLRETRQPPVAWLRKHGVEMAISTDLNPGTSPALSLRLMLNLACVQFGLTPEEALAGVTCHAAKALGLSETHGSIEPGKVADFVAWEIDRPADLAYWLGGQIPNRVVWQGCLLTPDTDTTGLSIWEHQHDA